MTQRNVTLPGEPSAAERLRRDSENILHSIKQLADKKEPFPGYTVLGRLVGLGCQRADYICRRLVAAGAFQVEREPYADGGPRWRAILADGSATGWGDFSRGVRKGHLAQSEELPPPPPVSAPAPMIVAAVPAPRVVAPAPPVAPIIAAANDLRDVVEEFFPAIGSAVRAEMHASRGMSWVKALGTLVEMGAICAADARASDVGDEMAEGGE